MNNLEIYYRALCEQLDAKIELLEKKIEEKKKEKQSSNKKKAPVKVKSTKEKSDKADKDYDGDGEVESKKEEYFGSRDKAIKKNMAKKKGTVDKTEKKKLNEGRVIGGGPFQYGGFPKILKETADIHATAAFNDGDDPKQNNVATKTDQEELWADRSLIHRGYLYPSRALMTLAQTSDSLQGEYIRKRRESRTFEGSPEGRELGQKAYNARMALIGHPHYGEFRKGHPSSRNRPIISDYGTYHPDTVIDSSREGT